MNKRLLKAGLNFLMDNKGIQKMFKDLEKTQKQVEAVLKRAEDIKNKHK
ncbi:hypothetical protein [Paenibacillus xerothermodurans]|nr:hypothetical protein [Paenibacillus xerothermodurans]